MLRIRSVAGCAVLTGALVMATAGAGSAATVTTPATGTAVSVVRLIQISSGAQTASVGDAALTASTLSGLHAEIDVVPAQLGGQKIGEIVITQGGSRTVAPSPVSLPVGSLQGPELIASASTAGGTPVASLSAAALGRITLDGMPLDLGVASLVDTASVDASRASADKTLRIDNVALPTIEALLAGLGLNLSALDAGELQSLAGVVSATLDPAAAAALSSAEAAVSSALSTVGANAPSTVPGATALVAAASTAADTAESNLSTVLAGLPTPLTLSAWQALSSSAQAALTSASAPLAAAVSAWQAAEADLASAQQLLSALTALLDAVSGALSAAPLAQLSGLTFAAQATAGMTSTASAVADVGSLDVLGVAAGGLAQFDSALAAATAQLTSALTGIPGVTFTAPTITVGAVSHSTGSTGAVRTAQATVDGLTIGLPTLTLPAALTLPGITPPAQGGLVSVATLAESASYTPSVLTTSTSAPARTPTVNPPNAPNPPQAALPETGLAAGVPITALVLVALGLGLAIRARRFG